MATLGEPLQMDMWRIYKSRKYRAKIEEKFPWTRSMEGVRGASRADWRKWGLGVVETMREELEAGGRHRGEELRAKEPAMKRLVTDLACSPMMYYGGVPVRLAAQYGAPRLVKAVGGRVVGAVAKRPKLARLFLTPVKRLEQFRDEQLLSLWYRLRGHLGVRPAIGRASAGQVRKALGRFSSKEIEEAARVAQQVEDLAAYSRAVKSGRMKAASSNRVIQAFVEIRRLTGRAFRQIPRRTAQPGTAEEAAAIARVKAGGGAAKAGARPLKPGEFRLREELRELRTKDGKLFGLEDRATKERVTAYRRAYYRRPGEARPEAVVRKPGAPGAPGARRPREVGRPVVARTAKEVESDLTRMIAAEPRYAIAEEIKRDLARVAARRGALRDPGQQKAALEIFADLEKRLGAGTVRNALTLLDRWGVTRPKQLYTLYNPAWYFKNYIDTVGVKNLLAGVPPAKLHRFMREMPRDVFGRRVDVGVTWTKELTGMDVGTSWFARQGNAIENTGRRALWDHVYQKTIGSLRARGGKTLAEMHRTANLAAKKAIAKVHFDYGDLSKLDEVMRRVIPFWAYQRNQLRWMAEQAVMRPRLMYAGFKFFDLGERGGGPAVRLPGFPTLQVQAFAVVSPARYMKTLCDLVGRDEEQRKRAKRGGALGAIFRAAERGGFYFHPFAEQGLSALLKRRDLMEDRNWKGIAPLVDALGKIVGRDITYLGVWRTMFPEDQHQPRMAQLERGLKRRVMMRRAFSILEGKEMSVEQARKYVGREMQVAGVGAFFGLYPKVREPGYERMKRLLLQRRGLAFRDRQEFDRAHPEIALFLMSLTIKQR